MEIQTVSDFENLFKEKDRKTYELDYKNTTPSKLLDLRDDYFCINNNVGKFGVLYDKRFGYVVREITARYVIPIGSLHFTSTFLELPINITTVPFEDLHLQTIDFDTVVKCSKDFKIKPKEIITASLVVYKDFIEGKELPSIKLDFYKEKEYLGTAKDSGIITIDMRENTHYKKYAVEILGKFMEELKI